MKLFGWRWHDDPLINTLIVPPIRKYEGADEALAARTAKRRDAADQIRHRANAVESGTKVGTILKMAAKR